MSAAQHHIIRRGILEVTVDGTEAEGLALQRKLVGLSRDWLMPALEEALTHLVADGEHWAIERLAVDAGSFTPESLERDFVRSVTEAVARQISERSAGLGGALQRTRRGPEWHDGRPAAGSASHRGRPADDAPSGDRIRRLTDGQSVQAAFFHFLASGVLPWWFRLRDGQTLEDAMTASWPGSEPPAGFRSVLVDVITAPVARLRLVRQFSARFLDVLLRHLSPAAESAQRIIAAELARRDLAPDMRQVLTERLRQAAFELAASGHGPTVERLVAQWAGTVPPGAARVALTQIAQAWPKPAGATDVPASPVERASPAPDTARVIASAPRGPHTPAHIDLDEGLFIDCAGAVLLHPFLPALFERLGIAADDNLLEPDRALAVLHYLATGSRRAPEYALVLAKLLCGLPLDEPAGAPVEVTDAEVAEAELLLAAVIEHWAALGDASPDALRGTFLTRPGKLSRRGDDDVLQVEPQSFDILLDRLPWGIGAVRLPWMTKLLWVEWRM